MVVGWDGLITVLDGVEDQESCPWQWWALVVLAHVLGTGLFPGFAAGDEWETLSARMLLRSLSLHILD